ncbi:hypothetical protein K488DRAFT_87996 [Vararia minispora EC-137]|uniref:Uncharacterized protein n=1 Tax=Vararia minispora EC-137 TaxID=1314806 RepID=A0ACB8QF09_9AGAM|nr:hypothetical protein K488DRAFT_87996 [Vararia minispora EC-137]
MTPSVRPYATLSPSLARSIVNISRFSKQPRAGGTRRDACSGPHHSFWLPFSENQHTPTRTPRLNPSRRPNHVRRAALLPPAQPAENRGPAVLDSPRDGAHARVVRTQPRLSRQPGFHDEKHHDRPVPQLAAAPSQAGALRARGSIARSVFAARTGVRTTPGATSKSPLITPALHPAVRRQTDKCVGGRTDGCVRAGRLSAHRSRTAAITPLSSSLRPTSVAPQRPRASAGPRAARRRGWEGERDAVMWAARLMRPPHA